MSWWKSALGFAFEAMLEAYLDKQGKQKEPDVRTIINPAGSPSSSLSGRPYTYTVHVAPSKKRKPSSKPTR